MMNAERLLRDYARAKAQRRQLKRSFELTDDRLRLAETTAKLGLEAIVAEHGPVFTVRGNVTYSKGWTVTPDDEALLKWATEARPGLVKQSVTQTALKEAGAKWDGARMVLEGEYVPGLTRERSAGISVSLNTDSEPADFDEEGDD
jgi:hypothetical protein